MTRFQQRLAGFALVAVLLGGMLAGITYFFPFLSDDALISLRYAERLCNGDGLTWTDGERVEGYSNLLWVLIQASLQWLGFDGISAARGTGVLGALIAIAGVSLPIRPNLPAGLVRALSGGMLLAFSAPLAVWAIGGLEHGFMSAVLIGAIWWHVRGLETDDGERCRFLGFAGLHYAALALLRLDGGLFAAVAAAVTIICKRRARPLSATACLVAPSLVAVLGQVAFRVAYYGEWIPNIARVKLGFGGDRLLTGLAHVMQGAVAAAVPLLLATWFSIHAFRRGWIKGATAPRWMLPWALMLSWSAYLVAVGGDIFPGWRQFLLAWVPLCFVVAQGAEQISARLHLRPVPLALLILLGLGFHLGIQYRDTENQRAKAELWEWEGYSVGLLLRDAFAARDPLLAVDAAGALPYWSKLRALDMLGLNDAHIAKHPPSGFGKGEIGHELGDGDYVWKRRPDLIIFNNASGGIEPLFLSGRQMFKRPDFLDRYALVPARSHLDDDVYGLLYVNRDGVLGIQRNEASVIVPGYFFASTLKHGAELDEQKRLIARIPAQQFGRARSVLLEPGRWKIESAPDRSDVKVFLRCSSGRGHRLQRNGVSILELDEVQRIELSIGVHEAPLELREVRLVRVNGPPTAYCPPPSPANARPARMRAPPERKK